LSDIGTLVTHLVKALVDRPDEVMVSELEGSQATVLEVKVAKTDHGKVIGKKGRTANAIRELLIDLGGKRHRRYVLEILE
jgi:predicted RNA-binding protein YlqC (UPF0109 family)